MDSKSKTINAAAFQQQMARELGLAVRRRKTKEVKNLPICSFDAKIYLAMVLRIGSFCDDQN